MPANPAAWITRVARNSAIDRLRRERNLADKRRILEGLARLEPPTEAPDPDDADVAYPDDRLRLIFTCCHPAIAPESRVALTLRTLGGLSTAEIARAFLTSESAMAQRLVRTKRKIRDAGIRYEVPGREQMPERLPSVTATLYLIYNEGYLGTASDALLREDLSGEAIRLASLLAAMLPEQPEVLGLLALMLLNDARRDARVGDDGLVPLAEQDRGPLGPRADRSRPRARPPRRRRGPGRPLHRSGRGSPPSTRGPAPPPRPTGRGSPASTCGWPSSAPRRSSSSIALPPSPRRRGRRRASRSSTRSTGLDDYQPYHAARAELLRREGEESRAAAAYERAVELSSNPVQRSFLERRRAELARSAQ